MTERGIVFVRDNLERSLAGIGARNASAIFDELKSAYSEPGRFYHTDRHIAECLAMFESLRMQSDHPAEIEVALWFHDAVYDTRRSDNEEKSSEWARRFLQSSGVAPDVVDRIEDLIFATKTHQAKDSDTGIMLDIDLAILGAAPTVFELYDAAIRREYVWVPEDDYRIGRARVLKNFLNRPSIYCTALFQDRYERRARQNLSRKIEELASRS